MARGKSLGNFTPSISSGKSLANYKASKNVKNYDIGDDSDSPLSSLDDSEDDEDPNDIGDSDNTVDSAPELIVDNLRDLSSDDESDGDENEKDVVIKDESNSDSESNSESDSESDSDSIHSKFLVPLARKKLPGSIDRKSRETTPLPVPKRLDLAKLREKQKREEKLNEPVFEENDSEEDDDEDGEEHENTPSKRRRKSSIVHHSYDERSTFPRSDSLPPILPPPMTDIEEAIINGDSDSEPESNADSDVEELHDESSGDEFDQDSLLAYLEQEESSPEVVDEYDDDSDGHIEKQEEKAIMNDIKNEDDLFSNPSSPYTTTPVFESEPPLPKEVEEDEEDDEDDDEISFDDDFFEPRSNPSHILVSSSTNNRHTSPSDDDDSYLWSYFFTSDEETGDEMMNMNSVVSNGGGGNSSGNNSNSNSRFFDEYYSGDETDEDLTIPPPSLRKPGTRATEILSSSAVASRPPVLGSWDLSNERPFGIIDGLTTRTLSPPQTPYFYKDQPLTNEELDNILNNTTGLEDIFIETNNSITNSSNNNIRSRKRGRAQNGFQSDSELSELPLDEFIYTDELDDVNEVDDAANDPSTLWSSRFNSDVPMSAFRNRGLQPVYSQPTTRRLSMTTRSREGRRYSPKEVVITPVRSVKKRMKKKLRRRKSIADDSQDTNNLGNTTDLIDELVESGALSPLFSGI